MESEMDPNRPMSPLTFVMDSLIKSSKNSESLFIQLINKIKLSLLKSGIGSNTFPICPITETAVTEEVTMKLPEEAKGSTITLPKEGTADEQSDTSMTKRAYDWDDIWEDEEGDLKDIYSNPKLLFGSTAKGKFWDMFKYNLL